MQKSEEEGPPSSLMALMNPFTALGLSQVVRPVKHFLLLLFQNGKQACRTGARTMELAVTVIPSYCETESPDVTVFEAQH